MNIPRLPIPSHIRFKEREEIDLYILSLLYELLFVSGGQSTNLQQGINPNSTDLTPFDNLTLYGLTLGIQTTDHHAAVPSSSRTRDLARTQGILLASGLAGVKHIQSATLSDVNAWVQQLGRSLFAYPDWVCILNLHNQGYTNTNEVYPALSVERFGS